MLRTRHPKNKKTLVSLIQTFGSMSIRLGWVFSPAPVWKIIFVFCILTLHQQLWTHSQPKALPSLLYLEVWGWRIRSWLHYFILRCTFRPKHKLLPGGKKNLPGYQNSSCFRACNANHDSKSAWPENRIWNPEGSHLPLQVPLKCPGKRHLTQPLNCYCSPTNGTWLLRKSSSVYECIPPFLGPCLLRRAELFVKRVQLRIWQQHFA